MAQVVERLPSKHEVLSANPSTAKKTKNKKIKLEAGHGVEAWVGRGRMISRLRPAWATYPVQGQPGYIIRLCQKSPTSHV
jgi:tartrate dehydratase beta subunit/fumarate hydratase class I family protein